jgi:hypothetical protein
MRSPIAKKIISETPEEVKDKVNKMYMKPDTQERPDFEKAAEEYALRHVCVNDGPIGRQSFLKGCNHGYDLSRKTIADKQFEIDLMQSDMDHSRKRIEELEAEVSAKTKTIDDQRIRLSKLYDMAQTAYKLFQTDQITLDFKFNRVKNQEYEDLMATFLHDWDNFHGKIFKP